MTISRIQLEMQLSLESSQGVFWNWNLKEKFQLEMDNSIQSSAGIFLSNVTGSNWNHTWYQNLPQCSAGTCIKLTNISWLDLTFNSTGIGIPVSFFHRGGVDFKWNSPMSHNFPKLWSFKANFGNFGTRLMKLGLFWCQFKKILKIWPMFIPVFALNKGSLFYQEADFETHFSGTSPDRPLY